MFGMLPFERSNDNLFDTFLFIVCGDYNQYLHFINPCMPKLLLPQMPQIKTILFWGYAQKCEITEKEMRQFYRYAVLHIKQCSFTFCGCLSINNSA